VPTAEGTRRVGSDPDEWLSGTEVVDFLAGEATTSAGKASFVPGETEAFEEGAVGWAATRLTITLPDGLPRVAVVDRGAPQGGRRVAVHADARVDRDPQRPGRLDVPELGAFPADPRCDAWAVG
jgi:hypothetical protein